MNLTSCNIYIFCVYQFKLPGKGRRGSGKNVTAVSSTPDVLTQMMACLDIQTSTPPHLSTFSSSSSSPKRSPTKHTTPPPTQLPPKKSPRKSKRQSSGSDAAVEDGAVTVIELDSSSDEEPLPLLSRLQQRQSKLGRSSDSRQLEGGYEQCPIVLSD